MKKLALALIASTVAVGAASANIGTGFYLGAAVGYGSTIGKLTSSNSTGSTDVGGNAANIGIMGGYGWLTGCLYFGGEVAYTFENSKITSNSNPPLAAGTMQLKRNGYFNAALRAGHLFTPNTMLYIRLGGNWGKWNLTYPNFSGSKNRLSFAPGLGLETAIHKNVYLRVEYTYEFGTSVRATNNANYLQVGNIRSQSGKVGLSYKF